MDDGKYRMVERIGEDLDESRKKLEMIKREFKGEVNSNDDGIVNIIAQALDSLDDAIYT